MIWRVAQISQNEANAMLSAAKKMKAKASKEVTDVHPADDFESDKDIDGVAEDGDESDWSTDTPMPSLKILCPSLLAQEPVKSPSR